MTKILRYFLRHIVEGLDLMAPPLVGLGAGLGMVDLLYKAGVWLEGVPAIGPWLTALVNVGGGTGFAAAIVDGAGILGGFTAVVVGMRLGFEWTSYAVAFLMVLVE
ncbi:MAG TPA: hypothetical protein VKA13_01260 [Gammaproteobacteria bacterium]|nr:hypothetical protein [Gammaproteobacteria bacterium]